MYRKRSIQYVKQKMARLMWFAVHDQLEDLEEGREVSSLIPSLQPMKTSFPQGNRNCYNMSAGKRLRVFDHNPFC
ncbi:unnamed protein product [Arabidopsis thaliana]|uniref:Uncharacterized protein n=1 Tax=Arabidopsis thaliana TaxID=3702 RepID=A0A654FKH9_ARATH|nr:unnamed protein product [Arabidopsis thaliana]